MLEKPKQRYRRHKRVRAKIFGTKERPRLCVFRSAKHIYAQLIDDEKGKILVVANDLEIRKPVSTPLKKVAGKVAHKTKVKIAKEVGGMIAKKALEKKFEKVIFDRGGYQYHGRVKAVAEGAREGGLKF